MSILRDVSHDGEERIRTAEVRPISTLGHWTATPPDLAMENEMSAGGHLKSQGKGSRNKPGRAFTLIEIMVSIGVLLILTVLLGQMLSGATKAWGLGESNTERLQNIRAITDTMKAELETALLPFDTSSQTSLQFVVNPQNDPAISAEIFGNRDAIFWQAPIATDSRLGDIAEIGYFVHWDLTTNPSMPRAMLCRFFVNPVQSGTTVNSDPNFQIYTLPSTWLSDTIVQDVVPIMNLSSSGNYQGLFAENVLGLWVKCLDKDEVEMTTGASSAFPSGKGYDSRTNSKLPAMVDVSFVVIDSSAARRITPVIQRAIVGLYGSAIDGNDFVSKAIADSRFLAIKEGLKSHHIRITLKNAK